MLSGYTRFSVSLRCVECRFFSTIMRVAKKTPTTRLARCDDVVRNVDWNLWWEKVETQNLASPGLLVCLILVFYDGLGLRWVARETQDFASLQVIHTNMHASKNGDNKAGAL